jgi:hypothetical protein
MRPPRIKTTTVSVVSFCSQCTHKTQPSLIISQYYNGAVCACYVVSQKISLRGIQFHNQTTYTDCDYIRGNCQTVIINSMSKQNLVGHILKDDCEVERYLTRWLNTQIINFYQLETEKLIRQYYKHINCDKGRCAKSIWLAVLLHLNGSHYTWK